MTWTSTRQARELLASCAQEHPKTRVAGYRFAETQTVFTGRRVLELRRIYLASEPVKDTQAWREWLTMTPQVAIRNAINNSTRKRAA